MCVSTAAADFTGTIVHGGRRHHPVHGLTARSGSGRCGSGARAVELASTVFHDNTTARALYRSAGFEVRSVRTGKKL